MTMLECPYCGERYRIEESVKHLNTRDCLRAQKALRRELDQNLEKGMGR